MQILLGWVFSLAVVAWLPPRIPEAEHLGVRPFGSSGLPGHRMARLARLWRRE